MEFRFGATRITYRIEERGERANSFCVGDVFGDLKECERALVIEDVYTEFASRNQGHAKTAVKRLIELVSPSMPVLAVSGALKIDFPLEPDATDWDNTLAWQREFLQKVGFTNINQYVNYENKEAFLYVNEMTQPYIDACEKREKEFEESKKH